MTKVKYTLDRIEDGQYVFLEYPNEENKLLIPKNEVRAEVTEGDIVLISNEDSVYAIVILDAETEGMRDKVSSLLEKLNEKRPSRFSG